MTRVVPQRLRELGVDRLRVQVGRDTTEVVDLHRVEAPRGELVRVALVVTTAAQTTPPRDVRTGVGVDTRLQAFAVDVVDERLQAARELGRVRDQITGVAARLVGLPATVQPDDVVPGLREPAADQRVRDRL